jgi:transcriptional regulator of acetoin/glycerol metabolism
LAAKFGSVPGVKKKEKKEKHIIQRKNSAKNTQKSAKNQRKIANISENQQKSAKISEKYPKTAKKHPKISKKNKKITKKISEKKPKNQPKNHPKQCIFQQNRCQNDRKMRFLHRKRKKKRCWSVIFTANGHF